MVNLELKQTFVSESEFINQPERPQDGLKLKFGYSYRVKYSTQNLCRAELESTISAENTEKFKLKFISVGIFSFDPNATKEDIHKAAYNELFPFARAFGATFTTAAGIPPIFIQKLDIDSQDIYRVDTSGLTGNK